MKILYLLILGFFVAACSRKPEEIHFGTDTCDHCKMTIMDQKYGAEIITAKGKILKFDSAECMVDYINLGSEELHNPETIYLTINTAAPGQLIATSTVSFLKDKTFQSPMGGNLAAFSSRQLAENNKQSADARIMTWEELLKSR